MKIASFSATSLLVCFAAQASAEKPSTFLRGLDHHRDLKGKATCPASFPTESDTCGKGANWSKLSCPYNYLQVPSSVDPDTGICSGPLVCAALSNCGCDTTNQQWICSIPGLIDCAEGSVEGVYETCQP